MRTRSDEQPNRSAPASIDLLTAVHHPVRRQIIDLLVIHGPTQVGTLAAALHQQVGSISHHLRMLERAGIVERAPELAVDGRTSWWRSTDLKISWSADDFEDRPADKHRAKVAEKLNFEHHVNRFVAWKRREESYPEEWRRAAFSSDSLGHATPAELSELCDRLRDVVLTWREEIDRDDGQEREPVFVFAHGVPIV